MSVPFIGVEPALVGMLSAAESRRGDHGRRDVRAAPVMTTVLPRVAIRRRWRWRRRSMRAARQR